MTPTADDLVKNLAALSRRFAGLAAKLAQAARELEGAGTLPPDSLLEEFAAARGEFIDLRSSVLDAARTLGVTAPAPAAIDGLKALEPVVRALAEATVNEPRRATLAEARRRVLVVLDRIMTINHVDDPNFAALLECQAKAREIRAAVLDPKGPTAESAAVIVEATPPPPPPRAPAPAPPPPPAPRCPAPPGPRCPAPTGSRCPAPPGSGCAASTGSGCAASTGSGCAASTGSRCAASTGSGCAAPTARADKARSRCGGTGPGGGQCAAGRRDGGPGRGCPVVGLGMGPVDELERHHRLQGGREAGAREVRLSPQRPDPAVRRVRGGAARLWLLGAARFPRAAAPGDRDQGAQQPEDVRARQGGAVGRRPPLQVPDRRGPAGRAVPRVRQECPARCGPGAGSLDPGANFRVGDGDEHLHPPESTGRRSGPHHAAPHERQAAVRRSPVPRDACAAHRSVLRGRRGLQGAARDGREAEGGPRRVQRRVAPDDAARGSRGSQVRGGPPGTGRKLGARAREGLRHALGRRLQPGPEGREEVRADPDLEEGRVALSATRQGARRRAQTFGWSVALGDSPAFWGSSFGGSPGFATSPGLAGSPGLASSPGFVWSPAWVRSKGLFRGKKPSLWATAVIAWAISSRSPRRWWFSRFRSSSSLRSRSTSFSAALTRSLTWVSVTSSSGSTLNSCRGCSIHFVTRSRASAAPAESMRSLVKDISIQAQFLANCGGSGSRRAGRPRRAREPSAPALELLPHEGRAAGQGCELLVAHVARRPAEAAVGVDRELLGRADGEDPADTLRDVLRCVLGEALHIDHTRAELAPIAVSLPEVELGHLAARELQHELVGPRFQDPGEVRLVRPLEA